METVQVHITNLVDRQSHVILKQCQSISYSHSNAILRAIAYPLKHKNVHVHWELACTLMYIHYFFVVTDLERCHNKIIIVVTVLKSCHNNVHVYFSSGGSRISRKGGGLEATPTLGQNHAHFDRF